MSNKKVLVFLIFDLLVSGVVYLDHGLGLSALVSVWSDYLRSQDCLE